MEQEAGQRVKTLDSLRRIAARGGIKNIPDAALFCQLTEGKFLSAPALVDEAQGAVRERDSALLSMRSKLYNQPSCQNDAKPEPSRAGYVLPESKFATKNADQRKHTNVNAE
jgi:hypothetical protein